MSLIEKLKAGTRNVKTIKFPGSEDDITMQILSNADIQDAVFVAERRFKGDEMPVVTSTLDAYEDERTTQSSSGRYAIPKTTKNLLPPPLMNCASS